MDRTVFDPFDLEKCTFCGECFNKCPVMELPLSVAIDEMKKLVNGEMTKHVLQKCTSCFTCNFICPEGANPTQLIVEKWHDDYQENGMKEFGSYFMTHEKVNFRSYVLERLPEDEKEMLREWESLEPVDEIFYPGCNIVTSPYLTKSKIFDGLNIRGSLGMCCGETYFRMGHYEEVKQVVSRLNYYFGKMKIKKMIIPCTAGYNMFTNILPRFGAKFDFEIEHFYPTLLKKLESGELKVIKNINYTATLQESCYGKMFGEEFMSIPRKILEFIGVKIVEEKYNKYDMLCCGIGGGFSQYSNYNPIDITLSTIKSLNNAKKAETDILSVYCAGCLQMFSTGKVAYPLFNKPVYHIFELVQMAIGEKPLRRQDERGKTFLMGTIKNQIPKMLSKKRYKLGDISIKDE